MPIALVQKERTEKGPQFPEPMSRCPHDLKFIKPKPAAMIGHNHASYHDSAQISWDEMSILVVPD